MASVHAMDSYLGMVREEAEAALLRESIAYRVVTTAPDRCKEPRTGPWRVVRQRLTDGVLELTVCQIPNPLQK